MQYIVDIVIALIILVNVIKGYRHGLVKTMLRIGALVAAVILAYTFGSTVGKAIRDTKTYENLCDGTKESIQEFLEKQAEENADKALEGIEGTDFVKRLESFGIDVEKEFADYKDADFTGSENMVDEIWKRLIVPVFEAVSNILGTVAVFVVSFLLLLLLSKILSGIVKLPFIHTVDKLCGLVTGTVLGVFLSFVLCMIIKVLLPYIPDNPVIFEGMEEKTILYGFLSDVNPLYILLVGKFFK